MGRAYLNLVCKKNLKAFLAVLFLLSVCSHYSLFAQSAKTSTTDGAITVDLLQGTAEVMPQGASAWQPVQTGQVFHSSDRLRVGSNSRMSLRWSDQTIISFGASSEWEILPPNGQGKQPGLHLLRGVISFFHRDKPGSIDLITGAAVAGVKGTEFVMAVDSSDATTMSVIDGQVSFGNDKATLSLTNGEQAVAEPGAAPTRMAGFIANNLLQWCFYYPAVIDPDELQLTDVEQKELADSLSAYRSGDLLAALAKYPPGRTGISGGESVYHAALLLAVGQVDQAESDLSATAAQTGHARRLGDALEQLVAAVKRQPPSGSKPELASELMAASYVVQSQAIKETSLRQALKLARQAAEKSPKFGFAWERLAELEFSFGDSKAALQDLDKSLALSPRNAQALALKGFALAAQDQPRRAREWFDRSIAADNALGNAWLGRGLTKIRLGDTADGREDLLVAAALEPQRAELRSYLGKAYAFAGDYSHATKELTLAKKLDPNDPTAWLYSALLNQQDNQINDAIRDLEKSKALNDNRSVYRSQLLLDEDSAVRGASLASMYRDDGMIDQSVREAGRAVSTDYANYSAHLFLANSYNQLRDPNWTNLRYETPANSEFWIANVLAPTSAGWLSPVMSEQPYTKLFDQNRVGVVSDTTYLDRGDWQEEGAQFGTYDDFSYSLQALYISDPGQRPDNDLMHRDINLALKYQLTPQDSVFVDVEQSRISRGDVREYYDPSSASGDFRSDEKQEPNIYLGYHHEWSPGVHTLFLAAFLNTQGTDTTTNSGQTLAGIYQGNYSGLVYLPQTGINVKISPVYYSLESQQIWEGADHLTVVGARYQWGWTRFQDSEKNNYSSDVTTFFNDPNDMIDQDFTLGFQSANLYAYHNWQILDSLAIDFGLAYNYLHQPADISTAPFSTQRSTKSQVSPKVGFIWTPGKDTIFRAAYIRSLSGESGDQSVRLEPTEVAGFNQAYRSLIPDTIVGDTSGSQFDIYDVSLEQKFDTDTYIGLSGELLYSKVKNVYGAFVFDGDQTVSNSFPDSTTANRGLNQSLDYREINGVFTIDQLLGKQWSVGTRYKISQARLMQGYLGMNPALFNRLDSPLTSSENIKSLLQTVNLHANWNHPCGLFSVLEANWYHQNNWGFSSPEPGDNFWQFNAYVGCRFWHRRAEVTVGLLNIGDQNYQLEPLNLYNETARGRTFLARLMVNF